MARAIVALSLVAGACSHQPPLLGRPVPDTRLDNRGRDINSTAPTTTDASEQATYTNDALVSPSTTEVVHSASNGDCGGDLPPCSVLMAESGGNARAVNPTGCGGRGCYGRWQVDPRTWAGFGGYDRADQAPVEVQDDFARQLWARGRGCAHWSACRRAA